MPSSTDCIFCQITQGSAPCHEVWSDANHMAFLSIFPNTLGFTVVMPKQHYSSYAFEQTDAVLAQLTLATKKVAQILDSFFPDVARCGMFFEGYGVDHLHSKLFPMHGTVRSKNERPKEEQMRSVFYQEYPGYLSSHDSARADDVELAQLAEAIRKSVNR